MPLGSSSEAPVMNPGPSTRQRRGLLGPTTCVRRDQRGVAATVCLLFKTLTRIDFNSYTARENLAARSSFQLNDAKR